MDKNIWKEFLTQTDKLIEDAAHAHIDAIKNTNGALANKLNRALNTSGEKFKRYAEELRELEISFAESSAELKGVFKALEMQIHEIDNCMARIKGDESTEMLKAKIDVGELNRKLNNLIEEIRGKTGLIQMLTNDYVDNAREINKRRSTQR